MCGNPKHSWRPAAFPKNDTWAGTNMQRPPNRLLFTKFARRPVRSGSLRAEICWFHLAVVLWHLTITNTEHHSKKTKKWVWKEVSRFSPFLWMPAMLKDFDHVKELVKEVAAKGRAACHLPLSNDHGNKSSPIFPNLNMTLWMLNQWAVCLWWIKTWIYMGLSCPPMGQSGHIFFNGYYRISWVSQVGPSTAPDF